ncbi:hypothetical protein [uncultured Lacinutrix sp.]|uniref:hypothetical protein n=1 Tax=uncultured Lacinutrix sp. TaxID=574032 RepID=UPI002607373A|nr:hypothetical protein [uncultured Lacinutrix sp.]
MKPHCSNCQSEKLIPNVKIIDFTHMNIKSNLKLEIVETSDNQFKVSKTESIIGNICGECGHVDLHVDNFQALWEFYLKNKK